MINKIKTKMKKPFTLPSWIPPQETVSTLSELGVRLYSNNGEFRSLADILQDVSNAYRQINPSDKRPLLQIELDNEASVPKVFYEGKEIEGKVRISFDWKTKGRYEETGGTNFNIEHIEVVGKEPVRKGIGLARGEYLEVDTDE